MKINRREFLKNMTFGSCAIVVGSTITGCHTIPTAEQMMVTSELIGRASGKVIILTKITDEQKAILVQVLNKISIAVPTVNQSFEDCWMKAAQDYLPELKLDDSVCALILASVKVASKGIDYIFEKRHPEAKQYTDLVEAAIHGFIDGIMTVIVPPNNVTAVSSVYDIEAYNYLKKFVK